MSKSKFKLAALIGIVSCPNAFALDEVSPEKIIKRLTPSFEIQSLGEDSFGETLSPHKGSFQFVHADLPKTGALKLLGLTRNYNPDKVAGFNRPQQEFADWGLVLPHIRATTQAPGQAGLVAAPWVGDWRVGVSSGSYKRCSEFGLVYSDTGIVNPNQTPPNREVWADGVQLIVPGGGTQEVLKPSVEYKSKVNPGQNSPYLITQKNWKIDCLSSTVNGDPGEGFLAISPDGIKYYLNWMAHDFIGRLTVGAPIIENNDPGVDYMALTNSKLMPTRIEDPSGNYVDITYSGKYIKAVTSSDGQRVDFSWSDHGLLYYNRYTQAYNPAYYIDEIKLTGPDTSTKTWRYKYSPYASPGDPTGDWNLTEVVLPDGRKWKISLGTLTSTIPMTPGGYSYPPYCIHKPYSNIGQGTITHPTGLVGKFTGQVQWHISKKPYSSCANLSETGEPIPYAADPDREFHATLLEKSYIDNGSQATWKYNYSASDASTGSTIDNSSFEKARTTIENPDGTKDLYVFNNVFGALEGTLEEVYYGVTLDSSNNPISSLRTVKKQYVVSNSAFPTSLGTTAMFDGNMQAPSIYAPIVSEETTQDGVVFKKEIQSFNEFADPVLTTKTSSVEPARQLRTKSTFYSNKARWIISLIDSVSNADNGDQIARYVYDASNGKLTERYGYGLLQARYNWGVDGNLHSYFDGNGNEIKLGNYKLGIPQTVTYPDLSTTTAVVNGFGEVVSVTDQGNATRNFEYNLSGWMISETQPIDDSSPWHNTTYSYDSTEARLIVTKTTGVLTEKNYYDGMLRPIAKVVSTPSSTVIKGKRYDWKGRLIFESYPQEGDISQLGNLKGFYTSYDALDRVVRTEQDSELGRLVTTTKYLSGLKSETTDAKGYTKTVSYQSFGSPSYSEPTEVQLQGTKQIIRRDIYGNVLSVTQGGGFNGQNLSLTKNYYYDENMRLCRISEPETGSYMQGLDGVGNILWYAAGQAVVGDGCQRAAPNEQKIRHEYDALNRLIKVTYPDGTPGRQYVYDLMGRPVLATSGTNKWSFTYNKRGLLTSEKLTSGSSGSVVGYEYDLYGSRSKIIYPNGVAIELAPDPNGKPTKIGDYVKNIRYFPDGQIKHMTYGNGFEYAAIQNARMLIDGMSYAKSGISHYMQVVSRDENLNLTQIIDSTSNGLRNKSMTYDSLNRLSSANAPAIWGKETFQYDPLNNIRKIVNKGTTKDFNYSSRNLLEAVSQDGETISTYKYDARGNLIGKNASILTFNLADQLTKQLKSRSDYDAYGNRVGQDEITTGVRTIYGYNQDGALLFERDLSSGKYTNYFYVNGTLVAKEQE
ncbi:hypothetical protein TUM18999_01710 [Pseudomonas tohonis]|uniref:RHS repeat protein n=1 Tax=Pseudomonas tohonis TaxID=2725477 RepID=A0A6J4DX29_9PSED|nr:RHS repeat protein [Pseudomonas tohonis]BCG21980.1 hypothetical protein TUM18999_01710 [Pseudomonas tohonis]